MIELTEYRPSLVELAPEDLAYLLPMVRGSGGRRDDRVIESITPTDQRGTYELRPGPFVGRLGLPSGSVIDIRSRFEFADVIELIRRAGRLPLRIDRLRVPAGVDPFLIDVLASAFVREVDHLVAQGLAKGYRRYRFDRPPYPGVPDVTAHLTRYGGRPDRLITTAKRITLDVEANRALAAALRVLSRVRLAPDIGKSVAALGPAFGRIGQTQMAARDVARITLDRLTARYEPALALAELILSSQELAPRSTSHAGASVLFYMPKVWESYVVYWATRQWGPDHRVTGTYTFDLSTDGRLRSEADVTVWRRDELVALYDAKYKRPGDTPSSGDVYQMVTYSKRLGISEASLIYPGSMLARRFVVAGVTVKMIGLDIDRLGSSRSAA